MKFIRNSETYFFVLGGLGSIGKNMYGLMHNDEIILIDAGIEFPEDDLPGIDYIIPDYSFLIENKKKIKALIITHGHLDHIGGIPFLLNEINIPNIYAPKQAAKLINNILEEKNIKYKNLHVYTENTKLKFKNFYLEFFRNNHSIPDSHGIVIDTPNGRVVTMGDFKVDLTPIGPDANFSKIVRTGDSGVKLMISDSTNALKPGFSISESKVDEALGDIFKTHNGRIIIATFASNIYRLKHIIETSRQYGRKVALFGRSMENGIQIAIECGYIKDSGTIIDKKDINKYQENEIAILCTGSQGEAFTALTRIADGTHREIQLLENDLVVFSSSPIPGNARSVNDTINKLYIRGVKVFTNDVETNIHTSGHGKQDELMLMIKLLRPEYFMPFHGDYIMLKKHAELAEECGVSKNKTFILDAGEVLALSKDGVKKVGSIPAGEVYVDGSRVGTIGSVVIRERKKMAEDGMLSVLLNIDMNKKELLRDPIVVTRGFILVNENEELIREIENIVKRVVIEQLGIKKITYSDVKSNVTTTLIQFLFEKTGRKPLILPVIIDTKKQP